MQAIEVMSMFQLENIDYVINFKNMKHNLDNFNPI